MKVTLEEIREFYKDRQPRPIGKHRFFSVLVPFVEKEGKLHLLFEVRAKDMQSQPGEICFPGGHVERGEDPAQCALRETFEEIGIPAEKIEMLGPGDILYGYANYTLFTYIGTIQYEDYLKAKPAPEEVDEVFLVELEKFSKNPPENHREKILTEIDENFPYDKVGIDEEYEWRVGNWDIPIYDIDGRIIWGLTARITQSMTEDLADK